MNRRIGMVVALLVMVVVWYRPTVAFAQERPAFGALDAGGMPASLIELKGQGESAGYVLNAGTPYYVWVAPKKLGISHKIAPWRRYGPWTLPERRRYIFIWEGQVHGGILANDNRTATAADLSPALATLAFQNLTGEPAWFIVNPLPPGGGALGADDEGVGCGGPLEGAWRLNSNSHVARLEFSGTAAAWSARVRYDSVGKWETLSQVAFDRASCRVSFVRNDHNIIQPFVGTLKGNQLEGQFESGGSGRKYHWEAAR